MQKWLLGALFLAFPMVSAASAASAGPEIFDVRRGATYGISFSAEAGCDVSPPQDLELEWDESRISWVSIEVTGNSEGTPHLTGFYRVPGNAALGHQMGPQIYCWDAGHTSRTLIYDLSPGGVVTYDASVSPANTAAGDPVLIEGFSLPSQCGDPESWGSRLSIRFDSQPRPWTSITGGLDEGGHSNVKVDVLTPGDAATGSHEWSIWCRNFGETVSYSRIWERNVQVSPAPPPPAAVLPSASASASPNPSASASASAPATASPATVADRSPATEVTSTSPTSPETAGTGWPRTNVIKAFPRSSDIAWQNPWLIVGLLLLAILVFLLIGFPAELFNNTFEENEQAIRQWLRLPPKRDWTLHPVRWPIVSAFVVGGAVLMALAEPSPIFSRETLITVLALVVAVPVTALVYEFVMERHARRTGNASIMGKLKPVYPAIAVAVLCALLSRVLHFVPGYVYGLIIAYAAVSGRSMSRRQEGMGVLKATAVLVFTAMLSWVAWQVWFADAAGTSTGFALRWVDTILGYVALIGLEAPLLGLLPLRFMDGRALWRWSKPLWLTTYCVCLAAFLIVLMDFGATGSDWSSVIAMVVLFIAFGIVSFAFWGFFAIRARRAALNGRWPATPS